MPHQEVKVRREALAPCMTCPLCHKLFRDATTIIECLHTFCRKCIYKELLDDEMESCPVCNIYLGCVPLEKLRPDHGLQDIRAKTFPYKSIKAKADEMAIPVTLPAAETVTSVTFPAKRKERSLSSLVISTPRVSTKSGVTGRRSKSFARKTSRVSSFSLEKKPAKKKDYSIDGHSESSSSLETLNKYTLNVKQNSTATGPSSDPIPDKGKEKSNQTPKRKADPWKPLNCLAEAANKSKSSKFSTQLSVAKSEAVNSKDSEELTHKTKNKENRQKSFVFNEKSGSVDIRPESETHKKSNRGRKKARNFGEFTIPPQVVLDAASARIDRINHPIWFSLVASDKEEGNSLPLPQNSANYIRIKDGRMPVSFIQKYLKAKLDLTSEHEVEIKCMGQTIIPTLTLNNLVELWLQTTSTKRVSATIGSSAKDFVMVLSYARRFPDS